MVSVFSSFVLDEPSLTPSQEYGLSMSKYNEFTGVVRIIRGARLSGIPKRIRLAQRPASCTAAGVCWTASCMLSSVGLHRW